MNYKGVTSNIIVKVEHLKRYLVREADISWIEFVVLSAIRNIEIELGDYSYKGVLSSQVVKDLGIQKDHVYRAIKSLGEKEYINIVMPKNPWYPRMLYVNGFGKILLKKVEEGTSIIPYHNMKGQI